MRIVNVGLTLEDRPHATICPYLSEKEIENAMCIAKHAIETQYPNVCVTDFDISIDVNEAAK